jgi:hypothetical protein
VAGSGKIGARGAERPGGPMSKTREKDVAAPAAPPESLARSLFGYLLGAGLGLVVLLGLSKLLTSPPARLVDELPHLSVLVELQQPLQRPDVRAALARLQRELIGLDLGVVGPLNYPVLLPPSVPGEQPSAKDFDQLAEAEFDAAAKYFGVGGYLVPRVYSPDLKQVVVRAAPSGSRGRFASGTDLRVRELCERFEKEGLIRPLPYSYALSMTDEQVREKTNVHFGVQTAIVEAQSRSAKIAGSPLTQQQIYTALQQFKGNPRVRAMSTEATFVHYGTAVATHMPDTPATANLGWQQFLPLARTLKLPPLVSPDGSVAFIEVTTDAEGEANRTLCYAVASAMPISDDVTFFVRRVRSH